MHNLSGSHYPQVDNVLGELLKILPTPKAREGAATEKGRSRCKAVYVLIQKKSANPEPSACRKEANCPHKGEVVVPMIVDIKKESQWGGICKENPKGEPSTTENGELPKNSDAAENSQNLPGRGKVLKNNRNRRQVKGGPSKFSVRKNRTADQPI